MEKARCELMAAARHADDEHLRWISGGRNQPSDDTAELLAGGPGPGFRVTTGTATACWVVVHPNRKPPPTATHPRAHPPACPPTVNHHPPGLSPSEQELACLHVDLVALLARVELGIGCQEQGSRATLRRTRLAEEQATRAAQSSIFGGRTMVQAKRDEQQLAAAETTTPNPPVGGWAGQGARWGVGLQQGRGGGVGQRACAVAWRKRRAHGARRPAEWVDG